MAENPNLSFHAFPRLPVELQDEIWNFAAASAICSVTSTPEVYITTPLVLRPREGDFVPSLPLTVDTPWPSMAHVCRNSRAVLLRFRDFKLRCHSPSQLYKHKEGTSAISSSSSSPNYNTTLLVPYRLFNPEIDVLYWSAWQSFAMTTSFLSRHQQSQTPNRQGRITAASLRSIAVEMGAMFPPSELAELLRRDAPYITSLTCILPAGTLDSAGGLIKDFANDTRRGIPPLGRCRIRLLTAAERGKVTMMRVPFGPAGLGITRLEDLLQERKKELEEHVVAWGIRPAETATGNETTAKTAWNESRGRFDGLDIDVGVFEEWTRTEGERWVEPKPTDPSKYRLLRYIPPFKRRDPQWFRVLDDEILDSTEESTRSHGWTDNFR